MAQDKSPYNDPQFHGSYVWEALAMGDASVLEQMITRPVSPEDFYYLLSRFPYIEVATRGDEKIHPKTKPMFRPLSNGWLVHDFGNVMRTSAFNIFVEDPYQLLKRNHLLDRSQGEFLSEDEGGVGTATLDAGTVVGQMVDAAAELIDLAIKKNWTAIEVNEGFYGMQRAAWIASELRGIDLGGFYPTPEDYVVLNWVHKVRSGDYKIKPAPGA